MKFSMTLLALLAVFFVKGQAVDFNQGGFKEKSYFIELPYENLRGKIIVTAWISDKPKKFIIDTGAPCAITENLYNELNPELISRIPISDISGKKDSLYVVRLENLKLGNTILGGVPTIIIKESILTECFQIDGIIGSNALRNSIIQFDSKNRMIKIASDISAIDDKNSSAGDIILDRQSSPVIKIKIGDHISEMLLFDSGADEFYSMSNDNMKKFRKAKGFEVLSESYGVNSMGLHGLSENSKTYQLSIPKMTINNIEISNVIAETSTDQNSRIGAKLLDYGIFSIDYKNLKCYFSPYEKKTVFRETFWEISPVPVDGKLIIGKIWSKDLAKKVNIGDQIISVDNTNTEFFKTCDLLFNSPLNEKTKAGITVKDKNEKIQTIDIYKK